MTIAYNNGGEITQTVSATAVAGQTYTLKMDVGFRKDVNELGYVYLIVGPHYGGTTVTAVPDSPPVQNTGNWLTYTARYTATAADSGEPITILFGASGAQGDFDNVRLNATAAVPEPASWALLIAGFGLVGATLRKRVPAARHSTMM